MNSLYSYRFLQSTISLLIFFLFIGGLILFLRPFIKLEKTPYEIGWNQIRSAPFEKATKESLPYLWVMTTKSHPQGKKLLQACINNKIIQSEINSMTIPIWTDLLLEDEYGHSFLPISRYLLSIDPLFQVWMFYPDGRLMSTWVPNKSTNETIAQSFLGWIKQNSTVKNLNLSLNNLHEQDTLLVGQKTKINLSSFKNQRENAIQILKQTEILEKIPIAVCFYGLEVGLDHLVKSMLRKMLYSPLYNPLDKVFRVGFKWNFLWKKYFIDFSVYSEQNAEIYLLFCKLHQRYPHEGYDLLSRSLFDGIKNVFWQDNGFIKVREGHENDNGISPYESFELRELYQSFSLKEQKEIDKRWCLFDSSNFQRIPVQKVFFSEDSLYLSLKKMHPHPTQSDVYKDKNSQLNILSNLLRGSRIIKDAYVQNWCLERANHCLSMSFYNKDNLNNTLSSKVGNLISLADFYFQLFKATKNKKYYLKGCKKIRKIYSFNESRFINRLPFLIPNYIPVQNILYESTGSKLIRLLWKYSALEDKMFPVKQFLIDNILLQNSIFSRAPSDSYFYFSLLEHISNYQGENKFKRQIRKDFLY